MRLSIRAEQMSVVEAVTQENFVRQIASHLLSEYPDSMVILPAGEKFTVDTLPKETLDDLVRVGIERARSYEMTFESSIATFTTLMFAVSPNFDTHNLFQVVLTDEAVEPNHRLDEIINILTEKNWNSIREKYNPNAWNLETKTDEVSEDQPAEASKAKSSEIKYQDWEDTVRNPVR